jgi:hypothetical protein
MRNLLLLFFCCLLSGQLLAQSSKLWLEDSTGTRWEGVLGSSRVPTVQSSMNKEAMLKVKIESTHKNGYVFSILIFQFRNKKNIFTEEAKDFTAIDFRTYKAQPGDLFVIRISLKDHTEKEFVFLVE